MDTHPEPDDNALDPREAARARRRDKDADAEHRDLMRPGMGKVFKQITDSIGRKATPDQNRAAEGGWKGPRQATVGAPCVPACVLWGERGSGAAPRLGSRPSAWSLRDERGDQPSTC